MMRQDAGEEIGLRWHHLVYTELTEKYPELICGEGSRQSSPISNRKEMKNTAFRESSLPLLILHFCKMWLFNQFVRALQRATPASHSQVYQSLAESIQKNHFPNLGKKHLDFSRFLNPSPTQKSWEAEPWEDKQSSAFLSSLRDKIGPLLISHYPLLEGNVGRSQLEWVVQHYEDLVDGLQLCLLHLPLNPCSRCHST